VKPIKVYAIVNMVLGGIAAFLPISDAMSNNGIPDAELGYLVAIPGIVFALLAVALFMVKSRTAQVILTLILGGASVAAFNYLRMYGESLVALVLMGGVLLTLRTKNLKTRKI